jgi:RNA polymerase sigma-70 factor (sigma-E family)
MTYRSSASLGGNKFCPAEQHRGASCVCCYVRGDEQGGDTQALQLSGAPGSTPGASAAAVASLYQDTAVSLIRLAYLILNDRQAAEDIVHEAFCSVYERWNQLTDTERVFGYVRASVLNGCRTALRRREVRRRRVIYEVPAASAEAMALGGAERNEVIRALGRLPGRQREAIVLRYYLNLPDEEIARVMAIRASTVRSTMHRALEAIAEAMREGT